jgi:uncharacterized membrane protein YbhN (UPF0104 family)
MTAGSSTPRAGQDWRRVLILAFNVATSALILAIIAWQLDWRTVIQSLSSISAFAIGAAFLAALCQAGLAALRFVMVVARFGAKFRLAGSIRVTLEGMFFSQTFLSFLGGDALRIWRIKRLGLPLTEATSAVVFDRLTGIVVNHVLLLASLPWLLAVITDGPVRLILVFLALTGVGGFGMILLIAYLRGRNGMLHWLRARIPIKPLATLLVEASSVGRHFFDQYSQLVRVLLVSGFIAVANAIMFAVVLIGMGVDAKLAFGCALLVPAVMEIAMLPISIAGWGVREGASIVAFGTLGLPPHNALGASVAFGLIVAAVSLIGGILWAGDRRKMSEISRY